MEGNSPVIALLKKLPKQYYFLIVIAILGMMFFEYGLIQYIGQKQLRHAMDSQAKQLKLSFVKTVKTISVDVEGGVFHTGVFTLPENSRVQDALIKAGGLNDSADRVFVAKHINLSAKLQDGIKIYIPRVGEDVLDGAKIVNTTNGVAVTFIDINTTSEYSLDRLPGIDPATAQKIIANRPYGDIQELVTRKIVSQKVFGKIKDKIIAQ
ncbi:MAG: helix-hairpin-helix domain-containing protein [Patescibacteria group bacterium]|nr:helix-hairpin-helix domain-containing protein [Patescibacteria group bacterium]MDE2588095.1 helix-hairpin-helix domain-containing protein [Patescibacteria group bacterium]